MSITERHRSKKGSTILERIAFWGMPEPNTGCTLWLGCIDRPGYASTNVGGHLRRVSRLVWTELRGRIPDGMLVCHKCDTRRCVNIEHLFLGTPKDNMLDMKRKGRGRNGNTAKLTHDDVRAIRAARRPARELAQEFGVSVRTIQCAVARMTWREVA